MSRLLPREGAIMVSTLGLVFILGGVSLWYLSLLPAAVSTQAALYELVVHVLFGGAILALGIHVERSELLAEERREVVLWCFAGFWILLVLAFWSGLDGLLAGEFSRELVSNVVIFGSMGGAFGAFIGVNRGRAKRNEILAEETERQRETLMLLTRLLHHDIRNDMQIIDAHAGFLEETVSDEGDSSLEVIQQRTDAIVRLLGDSATLVDTLGGDRDLHPVSLDRVVEAEVTSVSEGNPAVTVQTDVPPETRVVADGLIHQLFSNLLGNAVSHNDPAGLTIRVTARNHGDRVGVVVEDDGVGIPEDVGATCFELGEQGVESDGDGIGLYLVSRLAEVYGGSVQLADTDGGARFEITLLAPAEYDPSA